MCVSIHYSIGPAFYQHLVFIHVQSDGEAALFESQLPTIVALTKGGKSAQVVREAKDIPEGCGAAAVTPSIAVHTLVRVSQAPVSWREPMLMVL